MGRKKPKFDKQKCLKCKYHGIGKCGYFTRAGSKATKVFCDYATIAKSTCLKPINITDVVDLRGTEYNNCKLFAEGSPEREREQFHM